MSAGVSPARNGESVASFGRPYNVSQYPSAVVTSSSNVPTKGVNKSKLGFQRALTGYIFSESTVGIWKCSSRDAIFSRYSGKSLFKE